MRAASDAGDAVVTVFFLDRGPGTAV